ncbi:MAG: acyltransferase [Flavobacteriales bacterium]|nr:acyltransferase [Flavobacteriales bacterium]
MEAPHGSARIFGLDVMRAVAILWVVLSHGDDLLAAHWPLRPGTTGFDGVDLFFVLSGYLVGGLVLRACVQGGAPWHRQLLDLWQRRWFRTLPNYYLFLLLNITLVAAGLAPGLLNRNTAAYFVFLQNLWKPLDLFFWESWSLAVEEWFYLLFPVLVLLVRSGLRTDARRAYLLATLALIALPALYRLALPVPQDLFTADLYVRKMVPARLDAIGFGALAAWAHVMFPLVWRQVRVACAVVGAVVLMLTAAFVDAGHLAFVVRWSYGLSALAMALLLPLLSTWSLRPWWGRPVVFLSLVSYALYLTHLPLRSLFLPMTDGVAAGGALLVYVLWWASAIVLAWAVHRWWERPFMALRERFSRRLAVSAPSA